MPWRFDNTYALLPELFYKRVLPTPVSNPQLLIFNQALAEALDIPREAGDIHTYANTLSGNNLLVGSDPISQALITADLEILEQPLDKLIAYENQILREYQFVDYKIYKPKRLEVLSSLNTNGKLDSLIAFVKQHKPMIAVFAGSFNPFHKGHYNVLKKAELIFDKVIIAFGKNPDKTDRTWPIPKQIQHHQQEEYTGLLTDFVDSLGYDVIVVRGLRNSTDFQYEQNQYRYIQELKPDIKIVNIFCDKEFEHISSSGIRTLEKYGKHKNYLLE